MVPLNQTEIGQIVYIHSLQMANQGNKLSIFGICYFERGRRSSSVYVYFSPFCYGGLKASVSFVRSLSLKK